MSTRMIAGVEIEIDEQGYMTKLDQWTKDIGSALAAEEGIGELTDQHWKVIEFVRKETQESGQAPTIRKINKKGGIPTKELYSLFPDGPGKKAAKIAGVPKPVGCV